MIFINRRWNLYQNNMGFNLNTNLQYSAAYKSNILHICGILTSYVARNIQLLFKLNIDIST